MKGVCTTGCSHLLSALRTPFTASSKVSLLATHALSFYWKLSLFDFICESFAERKITLIVFLFNTPTMSYPSSRLRCFWEVRYRSWWDSFTCEESLLSCCFQILPFAFVSTSFLRCVSLWASVCFLLAVHWALEMQTDFHQTWGVVSSHSFFWYYFVPFPPLPLGRPLSVHLCRMVHNSLTLSIFLHSFCSLSFGLQGLHRSNFHFTDSFKCVGPSSEFFIPATLFSSRVSLCLLF